MASATMFLYDHNLETNLVYARAKFLYPTREFLFDITFTVGIGADLEPGFSPQDVADACATAFDMPVGLPVPPVI